MSGEERTHRLLDTTDAMVWAEEFCRIFNVSAHADGDAVMSTDDQVGLMVGWFANAIETGRVHPDGNAARAWLIGNWLNLYLNDATFHHGIDFFAEMLPKWVEALAEVCYEAAANREQAIRLLAEGADIETLKLDLDL